MSDQGPRPEASFIELLKRCNEIFPVTDNREHHITLGPDGILGIWVHVDHTFRNRSVKQIWRLGIDELLDWGDLVKDLTEAKLDVIGRIEETMTKEDDANEASEDAAPTAPGTKITSEG